MRVDCTALPVTLPQPLDQGERTSVSFDLAISVPNVNWRFGRIGSMALIGNALPVLAIHDDLGWHLDPYTSNGESFYSIVGDFTVTLTAPKALKVPATGDVTKRSTEGGIRTTTIQAKDVRDFAWASGPLSEEQDVAPTGVIVKVWWPDSISKSSADAMLTVGLAAMAAHAEAFGPYPYKEVDLVLGPFSRFGGMEYPQLVMAQPNSGVMVHELGHQWWFGIEGDDEYTEPWLDEAFASYATDLYFHDDGSGCLLNWPSDTARVTNSMAYWDLHPTEYFTTVYGIGSCSLHDLGRKLGTDAMAQFIHDYAVEHALGFSTTNEFKTEAQAVADGLPHPIDLTRFWKKHRIDDVP
jgi:aminopeptidase N